MRAGAARRRVAADVGAGQPGVLTDVLDEKRARLDVVCVLLPLTVIETSTETPDGVVNGVENCDESHAL